MSSATIGPISGINYGALVTGLTADDQSQIDAITTRTNTIDQESTALTSLASLMTSLQISSGAFTSAGVFKATTAAASNPSVINPSSGSGTPVGNYSFTVQQLASASQVVTQGFSSTTSPLGLSGKIAIRIGGGTLDNTAQLSSLNGGSGVARGTVRITDKSGASTLVDLSEAVNINDVVDDLNSATGVSISASVQDDHLVINDTSGGSGSLTIGNTGGTTTATDLGVAGTISGTTLTGTSLTSLQGSTALSSLNDGLGVRIAGGVTDFNINVAAGTIGVNLTGAKTISDVISKINAAGQSDGVTAAVSASGNGITLTNSAGGSISVTSASGSNAASDLGLTGISSSNGTLVGDQITSDLESPLLKNLNGGDQGQPGEVLPQYGTIIVNGSSVDLTSARSVNDVINDINASGTGVTAALNDAGTGLTLSSNAASFSVSDSTGNLASFLNIAGTSSSSATGSQIASGDEHLRYISENSAVSALSGGSGFQAGEIALTDGNGHSATIDLSNAATVGDVLNDINKSGLAISARINNTGDGILLTQTSGGTASIKDIDATQTAESLGISGSFSSGTLNGSLLKTINVVSSDTLGTISQKINDAGADVASAIINDGSTTSPYRLSLSSRNSGSAGRLVLDTSAVGLSTTTLVQGQDAVLVYGSNSKGTGGLTSVSSSNAITGLVPGLTLNLTGIGQTSVSVTQDNSQVAGAVQTFVTAYNQIITTLATDTNFDATDPTQNGILFGNSTAQQIQDALGNFVTQNYSGLGQLVNLASVGITVGQDGTLTLDTNQLNQTLASNPNDVRALFTTNVPAVTGGPVSLTSATSLSTLGTSGIPGGHITITDGFGNPHDVDLTNAATIGAVISAINTATSGAVTAAINSSGDGLTLTQNGGTGIASVADVSGGTTAASLNINGVFTNNQLTGHFLPVPPKAAVQGIGATLNNLMLQFTDSSVGTIFEATDALSTQETQLKSQQSDLTALLTAKKNTLIQTFANLEVNISQLQSQGSALSSLASSTASTKS